MANIKKKIKSYLGDFTLEIREPSVEEMDAHSLKMGQIPARNMDAEDQVAEQLKERVKFFDILHIQSSLPKDKIPARIKGGLIYQTFEYWEMVDEKN